MGELTMSQWESFASDVANGQTFAEDQKLLVRFELGAVPDPDGTKKEGRPIFRDVEMVRIAIPGDRDNIVIREATEFDKARFRRHYEAFKSGHAEATSGTPLSAWPLLQRSQVEELAFFQCKTVEQLSDMSDANISKFMGLRPLRDKARDWLKQAKEGAQLSQLRDELLERDNRVQTMERLLKEQGDTIAEMKRAIAAPRAEEREQGKRVAR